MCARYTVKSTDVELQKELGFSVVPHAPRYNLAPTQAAPIVLDSAPHQLTIAQWGLIPSWAKEASIASKLINARAESLSEKPAFKDAYAHRRCLVVADGFYEWRHAGRTSQPMYITLGSKRPFTMAGLWETWRAHAELTVVTFTIITTAANPFMAGLHDRMPVIIDREQRAQWLGHATTGEQLQALLQPWHGESLAAYEVSPHVNSVAVDDPKCIAPATQVQLSLL